jgi:hypothetical protein
MELLVKLPTPVKVKDLPRIAGKFIFNVDTVSEDPNIKVEWLTLTLLDIPNTNSNENKTS